MEWSTWSELCKITRAQGLSNPMWTGNQRMPRENIMEYGFILLISNTLMAIFLYILVRMIWQD